jgi:hypothetical protein
VRKSSVGIDVVDVTVAVARQTRDHRDEPGVEQRGQHPWVHPVHVAHVAVVHVAGCPGVVHHPDRGTPARGEQLAVDAGEPDRLHLVRPERREQVDVERPGVDHLGHLQGGIVGHPPARDDRGLLAQPPREHGGLGAAAVYHHHPDAERGEQSQLGRDPVERLRVGQDVAAEFDHEGVVAIGPHVAQRAFEAGDALG